MLVQEDFWFSRGTVFRLKIKDFGPSSMRKNHLQRRRQEWSRRCAFYLRLEPLARAGPHPWGRCIPVLYLIKALLAKARAHDSKGLGIFRF